MKPYIWLLLLCFVAAVLRTWGSNYEPPAMGGANTAPDTLTVLSYNVKLLPFPAATGCVRRARAIAAGLRESFSHVDVIVFQEVVDVAAERALLEGLVATWPYCSRAQRPGRIRLSGGVRILSKTHFLAEDFRLFPTSVFGADCLIYKGATCVKVAPDCWIAGFHMYSAEDAHGQMIRDAQKGVIDQWIRTLGGATVILAGDANERVGHLCDAGGGVSFEDRLIDGIWVNGQSERTCLTVERIREKGEDCSDHHPILATIRVGGSAARTVQKDSKIPEQDNRENARQSEFESSEQSSESPGQLPDT